MERLNFKRKNAVTGGVEFHAEGGRVVVRKKTWTKPGFKNQKSTGWVVEADGQQFGSAYPTASNAIARANDPGTLKTIREWLTRNDKHDDGSEEALKDEVLRTVLEWVEDGAEVDLGALGRVKDAAAALRTFRQQRGRKFFHVVPWGYGHGVKLYGESAEAVVANTERVRGFKALVVSEQSPDGSWNVVWTDER